MASMESARKELAGEYERVQKKAFTNWVNSHLLKVGQQINDLYEDLRDGSRLMMLIELLTGEKLPRERGKMRVHKLQNVQNALDFLITKRKIKLVNIHSDTIVDGKPTPTLALIWMLILHFQISGRSKEGGSKSPVEVSAVEVKRELLQWAQKATEGYEEVSVTNFTTSWKDGMAFCAIIDRHRPDLLNYDDCDPDTPLLNLEMAMDVAEKELGIVRLIDPEDICVEKPDEKAVMTYVSFLHNAFPDMPPPHRKKAPQVSLEDYCQLFESTQKWVQDKTKEVTDREFPNTVTAMKARMTSFQDYKTKQLPMKKRDMATLGDLYQRLQEQARKKKSGGVPPEVEMSVLEGEWGVLERETEDCEADMQRELERLQKLEALAAQLLLECSAHSSSLDALEEEVSSYEKSCTTVSLPEGAAMARQIREKLQGFQKPVKDMSFVVQQLSEGNYHDLPAVSERVEGVQSRLASLLGRLEGASSAASEAQEVVKVEDSIQELEVWLVSCGKFATNQHILMQIEEHKAFQKEQLASARDRVTRINSSPPPPGLEGKVSEVNARLQQIVTQTEERITGLEPLAEIVREFDTVKNPLEDWAVQQTETFEALPPLEISVEELQREQQTLSSLREDISQRRGAVEQLEELARKFEFETEPVQSLADRYARKLKTQGTLPQASGQEKREESEEQEASVMNQADALQTQWSSLLTKTEARSRLVDDLLDRLNQFNAQYESLREFVDKGNHLLGNERPVGEDAARLSEQMEICKDFRAQISSKQPAVDAMLALGRDIIAEPQTSAASGNLERKLTDFIQEWSDLQLAWQNWFNELHAHKEHSHKLSEQVAAFGESVNGLETSLEGVFPASVGVEDLLGEMEALQEKFTVEVLQPLQSLQSTSDGLRSSTALLSDRAAAEAVFEKFDCVAATVNGYKDELSGMVAHLREWWGGCEDVTRWLEGAESAMADRRPLAGSVPLVTQQKEEDERMLGDVAAHREQVESVLRSVTELASHERMLSPAPITEYHDKLRSRWEAVCEEAEKCHELSSSGEEHITSFAEHSPPFSQWLSSAEEKLAAMAAVPGSNEGLARHCEEFQTFFEEVQAKEGDMEEVEKTAARFLSSAKPYQAKLLEFRHSLSSEETLKTPEFFVDPEGEVTLTVAPDLQGMEYENGIPAVKGYSALLRRRYDSLLSSATQQRGRLEEARRRRAEFDSCLEGVLPRLQELEERSEGVAQSRDKIQDRLEAVRMIEVECVAMETQLQALDSAHDLWSDAWQSEEGGVGEGENEALREKEAVEQRHRALVDQLQRLKEALNAELSDAQAFQDLFSDFVAWLRETERKIQRDDPLRLEVAELKEGLAYLQGIAADISAHEAAYEKVCSECQELLRRGAVDSEELQQNLDNLQQRWSTVQIVNDDIEAIEVAIPKLEAFYGSYSTISGELDGLTESLSAFGTSSTSTDGIRERRQALQALHDEVEQQRSEFEELLQSCDLYDTPFEQTQFENDITGMKERLSSCDKVEAQKQASLTVLEKKLQPMEDLFAQFLSWLGSSEESLAALSPPSSSDETREEQLHKAKALVSDVESHEKDLDSLETAVNDVITLVDEDHQSELSSRLQSVSLRYRCHGFSSHCYPVERWLDEQSLQLCRMAPTGVVVTEIQDQLREVQEFQRLVENYRPEITTLETVSAKCTSPPPSGAPTPTTQTPQETEDVSKVTTKQKEVWSRYDALALLAQERQRVLEGFLPTVQQYESSQTAWEDNLCGWEERAGALPPPATRPAAVEEQIREIQDLLQSISDHEPEYVSLKKEAHTLCQGPSSEADLLSQSSQVQDSSAAFVAEQLAQVAMVRPGQEQLEATLADYDRRLEELKAKLARSVAELERQLERARECDGAMGDLLSWVEGGEGDLDSLRVRDPSSAVIEGQQQKCESLLEEMESREEERAKLHPLIQTLVSQLPPDHEERAVLLAQQEELSSKWAKLEEELRGHQNKLETAQAQAVAYEGAMAKLLPWVPETLSYLEGLGPIPTEPEMVEQRKSEVEALKTDYNSLAPVCATGVDNGHSLSSLCEEGEPRSQLDSSVSSMQTDWEKLGRLFGEALAKLTEALVQTQEFKSIAGGLEQWMSGMGETLNQQELIAARVKLIEGQIEGFKPILSDIAAYGETVEKTRAMGNTLKEESDPEERGKIEARLEGLAAHFSQLHQAAEDRMKELEDALDKATVYENRCDEFDQWLGGAEAKLKAWEPLSIASQPLKRQEEAIKEFLQEVTSYQSTLDQLNQSEESLLTSDLDTIQSCEPAVIRRVSLYRRSSTPKSSSLLSSSPGAQAVESSVDPEGDTVESSVDQEPLPEWLERPGASEAVVVGADIRARYGALKSEAEAKADKATQQLQAVVGYEADHDKLSEWLNTMRAAIGSFSPPAIMVEELKGQLSEVEDMQRSFTNEESLLESINSRGTSLVESCEDQLSRESGRIKLSDVNEAWGNALSDIAEREEQLKRALELAEKYQALYGQFDTWLSGCVERAAEALRTDGDPSEINQQLEEQKALLEEVKEHKPMLTDTASSGRELEDYATERGATGLPDIGYCGLEERYNTLETSLNGRISKLEETLERVGGVADRLRELTAQLEGWRGQLGCHGPPRLLPADVEKQIAKLSTLEQSYSDLQPVVSEALRQANAFSADAQTETEAEGVPSGAEVSELHSALEQTNGEVGELVNYWTDLLRASLQTANKFDQDYNGLLSWVKAKEDDLLHAEPVAGLPERVQEQLAEVEALLEDIAAHQTDLSSLSSLGQSMADNMSPEDSLTLSDKLTHINAAFESLQRNAAARKRNLEDGLVQAQQFAAEWSAAMEAVAVKSEELQQMSPVGADIDVVKTQLEEHKEFNQSVAEMKPQVTAVQTQGKQLKESCSSQDGPHITQQLEQLGAAWSKLYSDGLSRKHQLEDALLQLGQFHDALAQLLSWIADCTGKLMEAPPPGVKVESVEMQLSDLTSLDSVIASHEPTVASLKTAAEKLVVSSSAENTAEIEQDIGDLKEKWDYLKSLAAKRRATLEEALSRASHFHDNWKKEADWLTDAERRAYADWKPCGLPETCEAELVKHEAFMAEVESHQQPIEALGEEGAELKTQGTPEDGKKVDHWVEDVAQRWEELSGAMEEKETQLQQAKEKALEFDTAYQSLREQLHSREQTLQQQEPIHSEVEVVKQQLEEYKEYQKNLTELEGQLDDLEGLGQLLANECVSADREVILQRIGDLRALWDAINSAAMERQSALEESLLSLGQFEEAYSELWVWLTDALRQLGEAEPITGDPDMVAAQLSKHKVLQKQLGTRLSSRNAVTRAAKVLMKQKTGEDRAVLKRKLQDLEREWEKVCQMSVDRQSRLEEAYRAIGQFRSHLGPLRSWMAKVLPSLDESEPVHGDLDTVNALTDIHASFQKELGSHQKSIDSANASGQHLVSEILDDPTVTQQDMQEMNSMWENVCQRSVQKQERLDAALETAQSFEDGYSQLMEWMETQRDHLLALPPPAEDANILQQQIEQHKAFSQEVTARQPEYDHVLAEGQNLLQLAHPRAVPVLQSKLQQLERTWVDLRGKVGSRSEALASVLLELHGLQDMLDRLWEWVAGAEATMAETESAPVGDDLITVEDQLAAHEAFQEEMATHQPNMDALNKIAKKRKAASPSTNTEMTKRITSLYKRWQKLWLRSSERHRQLLEARTRLKDIALARSFNFDAWRKRFNAWVDQQKLRVNDLFRRFDGNHDGMLTREEFMKGLKASGLAMNQIELEKIADSFDRDHDGFIDLSEINAILRGTRRTRSLAKRPVTDSEKIEQEIHQQVSKCCCSKKFKVIRVAEGQYRFGDSQQLRLVRILRSTVMVRVGGGWEPLEEFLRKHDPCRASGRTNIDLRSMDTGLATASFSTKGQTVIASKNTGLRKETGGDKLTWTDPSGRKQTVVTKRTTAAVTKVGGQKSSREATPTRVEPLKHTFVRQASPKAAAQSQSRASSDHSKGKSPPAGEVLKNGQKPTKATGSTPTTPTHTSHIPRTVKRPISPVSTAHTATGIGTKASRIPTPSKSKVSSRHS